MQKYRKNIGLALLGLILLFQTNLAQTAVNNESDISHSKPVFSKGIVQRIKSKLIKNKPLVYLFTLLKKNNNGITNNIS